MGKESALFVIFGGISRWKVEHWSSCLSCSSLFKGCVRKEIYLSFVMLFKLDKDLSKPDMVCLLLYQLSKGMGSLLRNKTWPNLIWFLTKSICK